MSLLSVTTQPKTKMEHMCVLKFDGPPTHRMMTSVLFTIGSKSQNLTYLTNMIRAGMGLVRLNLSYDTHEFHQKSMAMVREAANIVSEERGYYMNIGIAIDIRGPEIRTGFIDFNGEIELKKGENIRLSINRDFFDKGTKDIIYVDYPNIINVAPPGTPVYIYDGRIRLRIKEATVDCLICEVEVGGSLGSQRNVILPGIPVDLPSVSEKDRFDIEFAIENNADVLFAAGVRSAKAVKDVRQMLGHRGKDMKIIARLDNVQALSQLDEICRIADGIIFSRYELGIEVSDEKLFLIQKAVFAHCNKLGKPVIGAGNLLESMLHKIKPTRPEVFDLGNMLLDGADGILISSETSVGSHPEETGLEMIKVCREAESAVWDRKISNDILSMNYAAVDAAHAIAISAVEAAEKCIAPVIVVLTTSGRSAYVLSRYRPRCPILGVTRCSRSARQMRIQRGIIPILYKEPLVNDWTKEHEQRLTYALTVGLTMGLLQNGDPIVTVSSWKDHGGYTNNMRIVYAYFEDKELKCKFDNDAEDLRGKHPTSQKK